MIGSLALAAALGIVAILLDNLGWVWEEILVTSLFMAGCSTVALVCEFVRGRHRVPAVCLVGMWAAGMAFIVWSVIVWFQYSIPHLPEMYIWKTAGTLTVTAIWAAHLGLLVLLPLDDLNWRKVRVVSLALVGGFGGGLIILFWTEYDEEWFIKTILIDGILAGSGTVVTPVLALIEWIKRRSMPGALLTETNGGARVVMRIVCPRCRSEEDMPVGRNHCSRCGLRITLDLEEPRCTCGYLLYKLQSNRCPECGKEIAAEERWGKKQEDDR